jgi:hypothetical protein
MPVVYILFLELKLIGTNIIKLRIYEERNEFGHIYFVSAAMHFLEVFGAYYV